MAARRMAVNVRRAGGEGMDLVLTAEAAALTLWGCVSELLEQRALPPDTLELISHMAKRTMGREGLGRIPQALAGALCALSTVVALGWIMLSPSRVCCHIR